ncbi:hypothetical protein H0H93_005773 [Arthromyces matolae]|nr:hypothetical protein H0H93_005773 [Arthromyces matolae]
MTGPQISTSRSILMHTALAYLTPEIRTFDLILQGSLNGTLHIKPSLPAEILLAIRFHLFPVTVTHLFERSHLALAHYESSLRKSLCQECLAYNQEVYGPDVWEWEHFTGACSCGGNRFGVDKSRTGHVRALEYYNLWKQKQTFPDCSTWLELYLSLESARLAAGNPSIHSIWDVVTLTLKDHGCRLRIAKADKVYCSLPWRGMQISLDITTPVLIVPDDPTSTESLRDINSTASITIHRVNRDLCLSYAYDRGLQMSKDVRPRQITVPPIERRSVASQIQDRAIELASVVSTVVVAAVTLPITVATVALAVFCFYSPQSRALRII